MRLNYSSMENAKGHSRGGKSKAQEAKQKRAKQLGFEYPQKSMRQLLAEEETTCQI